MKYFVCSDIHGFYDEWMKTLAEKSALKVLKIKCGILLSWTEAKREQYIDLTAKSLSEFKKKIGEKND